MPHHLLGSGNAVELLPGASHASVDFRLLFESAPGMYLVVTPDFQIVAVSDTYLRATMTERHRIERRSLFEVFPNNPKGLAATGVRTLRASLERVLQLRVADAMAVQKYDVPRPESAGGGFEERYWSPVNTPVFGRDNEIAYIIHRVDDVTEYVRREEDRTLGSPLSPRESMEAEIVLRGHQVQEANRQLRIANEQLRLLQSQLEQRIGERTRELTEANEKLRATEESSRRITQGVRSHAIFMLDPAGIVTTWNPGAEIVKGYRADEVLGLHFSRFYLPEDVARGLPQHALHTALERGCFEEEGLRVRKDGSQFWAIVTVTPIYDHTSRHIGFVKVTQDITPRKKLVTELEDANRFNRATLDGLSAHIAILSEDGNILAVNDPWERFSAADGRATRQSLVGDNYLTVCDQSGGPYAHEGPVVAAGIRAVLAGMAPQFSLEYPCHSPSEQRWFIVRVTRFPSIERQRVIVAHEDITERKHAEAALRERERLLAIVTASARVGLVIVGAGYRYLFANEAYAEIFGLKAHDIVNRRVPELLAAGWSQIQPRLDRALAGERITYELTLPPLKVGQTARYFDVVYEPRTSDTEGTTVVVVVVQEVTDHKLAESALRLSEQRLRLMVEALSDHAIFMLDPNGQILTWSRGAEQIDGYSAEEVIGRHYSCLFTPEAIANGAPQRELEQAAAEGRVSIDGWRVRKDGSWFWANGTLVPLYDNTHSVTGFTQIIRDLTAKRRNDELLRSILDSTLDAIISIDERGIVSMLNRAGEKLFGFSASEVVGQNVNRLMPDPYRNEHASYISNYLRTGEAKVIGIGREVQGLRKGGSTFPLELAVTEFRLDNQRHFVGIVRDISEKKLLESQIRQSQKMEAFGQLAGGVAHDFNNLLTVISGYSEMLLTMLPPGDPTRNMVEQVCRAGERAAGLTRQLLFFGRQALLEMKVLDLNAEVKEMEKMLRRMIGEDIHLTSVMCPQLGKIKADPGLIGQVLMNLAVNARDAMPHGGKLTIETSNITLKEASINTDVKVLPGQYVLLTVSDTGTGMPPEVKARIFEPFYTTKGVGKGTGLGLSVVHGIVRQSNGHVEVQSETSVGTKFKLYFPMVEDEIADRSDEIPTLKIGRGRETVLLVEDEDNVREIARLALQTQGFCVLSAASAMQAIEILSHHTVGVDILVTDVVMPEMSGRQLTETLRSRFPRMKVLYLSGYTDDAVVRHGILQAEVAFLAKPYTPLTLVRKVRQVLDKAV